MGEVGRHQDTRGLEARASETGKCRSLGILLESTFGFSRSGWDLTVSNKLPDVMLLLQGPYFDRKPASHTASLD